MSKETPSEYLQALSVVIQALSRVEEFLRVNHTHVTDLFRVCDVDQSGCVSKDELVTNLLRIGLPISFGQARHLVRFLAGDGNDEIGYEEFRDAFLHFRRLKEKLSTSGDEQWLRGFHIKARPRTDRDPVFSDQLVARDDFQAIFSRYKKGGEWGGEAQIAAVADVLEKPCGDARGEQQLHAALDWLLGIPKLRPLGARRLFELARQLTLATYKPDRVIMRQGARNQPLHIVLSGRVSLQYNKSEMSVLRPGSIFGEKTLWKQEPTPMPAIIAITPVRCACLTTEDTLDELSELLEGEAEAVRHWLHGVAALTSVPRTILDEATPYLVLNKLKKGRTIFRQGEGAVCIYFLKKGKVEIRSCFKETVCNKLPTGERRQQDEEYRRRRRIEQSHGKLGEGAIFGEDCLLGYHDRQYTARVADCCASVEVYQLRRQAACRVFKQHQALFQEAISHVYRYTPFEQRYLACRAQTRLEEYQASIKKEATPAAYVKKCNRKSVKQWRPAMPALPGPPPPAQIDATSTRPKSDSTPPVPGDDHNASVASTGFRTFKHTRLPSIRTLTKLLEQQG